MVLIRIYLAVRPDVSLSFAGCLPTVASAVSIMKIFPRRSLSAWVFVFCLLLADRGRAALPEYDAVIAADFQAGLRPLASLLVPAVFYDTNRQAFNFGSSSGDVTMEFILEGDPAAGGANGYLAVGSTAGSSLRYEQWNNTGQVGFTQNGVADYVFSPAVPSPTEPAHLAFVWTSTNRTMRLYINGTLGGTQSGVAASFAMPRGVGSLGNSAAGTEGMVGTIYRVTVYDDALTPAAIQRHADAFTGTRRPPVLLEFTATPPVLFPPAGTLLSWKVQDAEGIWLDGSDVTGLSQVTLTPEVSHVYELVATNQGGSVTGKVAVTVNPSPEIRRFETEKVFVGPGEPFRLSWDTAYGQQWVISPQVGDVTVRTVNGQGSVETSIVNDTTFSLSVRSPFGEAHSDVRVAVLNPAQHVVISEFMADNRSGLKDEDGATSDWIELYNPTAEPVSLLGYALTDDPKDLSRWKFPDVSLPAHGFLLVFASGKNRLANTGPLHANFELNQSGEYLALVGPGPVMVHEFSPAYPAQASDIAYGVLAGDLSTLRFLGEPTPGASNRSTPPPPGPVLFSQASGTFTNGFEVTLSSSTVGSVIRYTLDGSTPSLSNGIVYASPVRVEQTRRLRAAAFVGQVRSVVTGESYIKLAADLVGYQSTLPILLIENFGAGVIPQKGWSGNGSGIKQVPRQTAVWATFDRRSGVGQGTSTLVQAPQMMSRIGIRGRGAFSSTWRQKPFSVEAENEMGEETAVSPLDLPEHSEWILYYPDGEDAKDPTLLFNTFAYELSRRTGRYSVRFRWVEAFVNEDGGDLKLADRRGVYAIIEKVSRGKDRLDFERLAEDGSTGGWLLNINRMDPEPETGWPAPNGARQPYFFHTAGPNRRAESRPNDQVAGDDLPQQSNGYLNFDNPNGYVINPQQRAAIENWFKRFEDVFFNNSVWRNPTNGYRQYLDTLDFADYFILNTLTHNGDGLLISMFPWKGRDEKLRMGPAWDYNWSPYYIGSPSPSGDLLWRSEQIWYARLFTDPDFVQEYMDRWWSLRQGPLSDAGMDAVIDEQAAEISPAKAILNGVPTATEWANRLNTMRNWLKARAAWIDSSYVRPPYFNQPGGEIPNGFQLVMGGTNGTVYFTLDGSDPRLPGGAVNPTAQAYVTPVVLNVETEVKARLKRGAVWSGLTRGVFSPAQDLSGLFLSEIMYNPQNFGALPGDDLEFLELQNGGSRAVQLGALAFTEGIQFSFPPGANLNPGARLILARNRAAFQARYPGVSVFGEYSGKLDNNGERLTLSTVQGGRVFSIEYNDRAPWPLSPDGYGFSLVPIHDATAAQLGEGASWRASALAGGSPGEADPEPSRPGIGVVVNEIVSHTALPDLDRIEFYNPGSEPANISGWYLSDDGALPRKYRLPSGSIVPAHGYWVIDESKFNAVAGGALSFALSAEGDSVYLTAADAQGNFTGYGHGVSFGASERGRSLGRYVNSVRQELMVRLETPTFGATNSRPAVGPVVIQEIHYHPEGDDISFVELQNISSAEVKCFDIGFPTNTWRLAGFGFSFPTNVVLAAGQRVLIVSTNASVFRSRYAIPSDVPVFGEASGSLQNNGERLELERPGYVEGTNGMVYVAVDGVRYDDHSPWPSAADGGGPSLQRRSGLDFADDPANWVAALPTPGQPLRAGDLPRIVQQPVGRTLVAFLDTSFAVEATGTGPLFYQWTFNGAPLLGETNSVLQLKEVAPEAAGFYQAIVYSALGSAVSEPAALVTILPATIVQQPLSRSTNAGARVSFSVTAVGIGPIRYQWFFKGNPIQFATNTSLALTNVQVADAGPYQVVVTDDVGSMRSQPAHLVVNVRPVIVSSPVPVTVVAGEPASFRVAFTGTPPFSVRWRRGSITVSEVIVNGFESTYVIPSVQTANAGNYSALVGNAAAANVGSASAALVVLADTDRDGIPDVYENQTPGFSSTLAEDAGQDFDGDGFINLSEYRAGTDPHDPASLLRIREVTPETSGLILRFIPVVGRSYGVDFLDQLTGGSWQTLTNLPPVATPGVVEVLDPAPRSGERFYRVRTP